MSGNLQVKENGIQEMLLRFDNMDGHELEINIEGITLYCTRDVTNYAFYDAGDAIKLHHNGLARRYSVKIKKTVFVENDPTKRCRVYPNSDFASYR